MNDDYAFLWEHLGASPLFWLTLTVLAYLAGLKAHALSRHNPLVNPVLVAVVLIGGLLWASGTDYGHYFTGARFIHFLLGPAVVALAVPLYLQARAVKQALPAVVAGIGAGSVAAVASVLGVAYAWGLPDVLLLSLSPKSVTTAVAVGISETIGGLPALTAVVVISTGILGAMIGGPFLDLLRVDDQRARGVAVGTAAHAIGTARQLQASPVAGAFSGLAMGLNALLTALLLPLAVGLLWR